MSSSPYQEAGNLLQEVIVNRRGLKSAAFSGNHKKKKCSKTAYAQACKTLRHKGLLDQILNLDNKKLYKAIKVKDTKNQGLLYVLLFELLFGLNQKIRGGGAIKRNICKMEQQLRHAKDIVLVDNDNGDNNNNNNNATMVVFPRYIRINTLKDTTQNVIQQLYTTLHENNNDKDDDQSSLQKQVIYRDRHVPDLIVLSPNCNISWYQHPLVSNGHVVLQDKSSCFSALALVYGSGGGGSSSTSSSSNNNAFIENGCDFIDACAAPGNKTTHLAALVSLVRRHHHSKANNQKKKKNNNNNNNNNHNNNTTISKIFGLDKSSSRIKILQGRVSELVPSNTITTNVEVQPLHQDFLKVQPDDPTYKDVKAILLDPSCSGSGIVNSVDRFYLDQQNNSNNNSEETTTTIKKKSRVETIASFQRLALLHAMSFPNVQRIVYSTCSIHVEENEMVASTALHEHNEKQNNNNNNNDEQKWKIVAPMALQGWHRRGFTDLTLNNNQDNSSIPWTKEEAQACIRVDGLKGDETNGFFVCCFERLSLTNDNNDDGSSSMTKKKHPLIHDNDDDLQIPLYNNEFQQQQQQQQELPTKKEEKPKDLKENDTPKNIVPNKNKKPKPNNKNTVENKNKKRPVNDASDANNDKKKALDKMAKKKAKKLAWKRKQKEQKMMRLLKKEAEKS